MNPQLCFLGGITHPAESKIKEIVDSPLLKNHTYYGRKQKNLDLLNNYSQVSLDLGGEFLQSVPAIERGDADISYISKYIPASLDGLGAWGGGNPHSKDETIELSSLAIASKRAAIFTKRYATNFL